MDQNPPKESRPPINLRIKFRSESVEQFIERYAVDVSRGGIFIRTREPLAVGTHLKLDFQFQNGSALMAGDGTVVWIREFDANRTSVPPGMGVRFDKLTPESQAVLEQLLIEKAKRERSGIPGSGSQGAGGIAVRRPSSTFSVLDGQAGPASGSQPAAPANTGTTTSSGAGAGQSGPLSPLAAVAAHAAARGADPTQKNEEPAAYRPLGTARNPFSSIVAPEVPGSSSATPSINSSDVSENSAAPFDDINDEPTQIAGRLPSFLLSDDDATVANAQVPGRADTAAAKVGKDKGAAGSGKGSAMVAARAALPGMGHEQSAESGKHGADDALSSNDEAAASRTGDGARPSGAEAIVPADAAASKGATTASSIGATISATASASTQSKSDKRRSGAVLVAASVVVLGASGIFLFRFFSSQSTQTGQSTASSVGNPGTISAGPGPSPATAETQPAPAPGNGAGADVPSGVPSSGGEAAAPAAPPPSAAEATVHPSPPGASAEPEANSPSLTAPLVADAPEPSSRKLTKRKPARSTRDTASATPVGESKSGESKAGESKSGESKSGESKSGETKSGETKSGEVPSVAPPGTAAAPAASVVAGAVAPSGPPSASGAAAAKPEDKAAAATDTEAPGHQIRVTSKPDGADVTLDGQTVGKTPFVVGIADLTAPHIIAVRKDGFEPFEQMISATSAWSRPKPSKGKPTLQILKITVKLKPVAGAEARPATQPEPEAFDSANKGQPAKAGAPAKSAGADSPLAPTEVRPAAESKP